jgi:hypothetical protein
VTSARIATRGMSQLSAGWFFICFSVAKNGLPRYLSGKPVARRWIGSFLIILGDRNFPIKC